MNSWFIKNFKSKEAVIVYYTDERKKTSTRWVLPKDGLIELDGKTFKLDPNTTYSNSKGIPTIYLNYLSAVPINIYDTPKTNPDPKGLHTAINAQVAQEMWNAAKKQTIDFASMAAIGAFLGVLYLAYMLSSLTTQIEALQSILGGN